MKSAFTPSWLRYLLILLVAAPSALPAYGYLDPTSGSLILQLVVGGVAGAAVLIRLYWHKLLAALRLKRADDDTKADDTSA